MLSAPTHAMLFAVRDSAPWCGTGYGGRRTRPSTAASIGRVAVLASTPWPCQGCRHPPRLRCP
eukprot:5943553-Lingulodinium_polyedra.AAC.1